MRVKHLAAVSAMVVLLVSLSLGQALRGRISGTVKDPQGNVVPNASIAAKNVGTGETLNATSSDEGTFLVPELKPGTYTITAEVQGFKKSVVEGVQVQVATVTSVLLGLEVGSVNEEVTVAASDAQVTINTANAEVGEVVD